MNTRVSTDSEDRHYFVAESHDPDNNPQWWDIGNARSLEQAVALCIRDRKRQVFSRPKLQYRVREFTERTYTLEVRGE